RGCLHLKSAITVIGDQLVLVNPEWISLEPFGPFTRIEVAAREPYAANAVRIGDKLVYPRSFPRTRERLEHAGLSVRSVDVSELQKAEGAVTCCSLIFET